MKACLHINRCKPLSNAELLVGFHAHVFMDNGQEIELEIDAAVPVSPSANTVNTAMRNRLIAHGNASGFPGLASGDIFIFGGVS